MKHAFSSALRQLGRSGCFALLLPLGLVVVCGQAIASAIDISAEFTPDAKNPNSRVFTNTTPWQGICTEGHMAECIAAGAWSIDTGVRGTKTFRGDSPRNRVYLGMPGPRTLVVRNEQGEEHALKLAVTGMAYRFDKLNDQWGGGGRDLVGCKGIISNFGGGFNTLMRLVLRDDGGEGNAVCNSVRGGKYFDNVDIQNLEIVYSLETDSPLEFSSGVYVGSTTYTVGGAGNEIDLGDGVSLDSPIITVNFTLKVNHYFDVRFPPGSTRAVLAPLGGWTQWTDHGRAPTALLKELPFSLSSSSLFKVLLRCQFPHPDGRCAMRNQTSTAENVPVDVSLTVPGVHDRTLGRSVVDYPLTTLMEEPIFDPQGYVYERPSRLEFRVDGSPLAGMLNHPGSSYSGNVTIIFESDL